MIWFGDAVWLYDIIVNITDCLISSWHNSYIKWPSCKRWETRWAEVLSMVSASFFVCLMDLHDSNPAFDGCRRVDEVGDLEWYRQTFYIITGLLLKRLNNTSLHASMLFGFLLWFSSSILHQKSFCIWFSLSFVCYSLLWDFPYSVSLTITLALFCDFYGSVPILWSL